MTHAGDTVAPVLLTEKAKKKQPLEKPRNVVAYIRVSTRRQAEFGYSLEDQKTFCEAYCTAKGFEIIEYFIDGGGSGRTDERKAFQEMLKFCRKNMAQVHSVVVFNTNRLYRNTELYTRDRNQLRRLHIGLITPQIELGDSPEQKWMENQLAAQAQYESDVKVEMGKKSMYSTLRRGRLAHKAPIGYLNERMKDRPRGTRVVKDPDRAPIVAECFRMLAYSSRSKATIYRWATEAGLTNVKSGKPIAIQTFHRIFENCRYAGIVPVTGDEFVLGEYEPIISRDLFELVQSKLRGDVSHRVPHNPEPTGRPLQGIIRCPGCGKRLTGSHRPGKGKKVLYGYYHHPRHHKDCPCPGIHIPVLASEASFIRLLESMKARKPFLQLVEKMLLDMQQEARKEIERDLKYVVSAREEISSIRSGLRKKFAQDQISQKDYEDGVRECESDLSQIDKKEQELRNAAVPLDYFLRRAVFALEHLDICWQTASEPDKRKIAKTLFPDGVTCSKTGDVGTPKDAVQFSLFDLLDTPESAVATPTGLEPVSPA